MLELTRRRRAVLAIVVVVALLAAVAIASTGDTPLGSGGTRRPGDRFLDVLVSLVLVLMALGTVAFALLLFLGKDLVAERARWRRQHRGHGIAVAVACFVVLAGAVWWMSNRQPERRATPSLPTTQAPGAPEEIVDEPYNPRFALIPMLVLAGLVVAGTAAAYVSHRARRRHLEPGSELALALADALEETLDDLRAESDPRRAVIAAYARLERILAAYGLPRSPAEAPQEYVGRILGELSVGTRAVERLTALFVQAKFSQHVAGIGMKAEAIEALEEIRVELRAEERRAAEERATAIAVARERAAP